METGKHLELAMKTLASSVVLGLLGNQLLGTTPWGVGFTIYLFLIVAVAAYLFRHRSLPIDRGVLWLVPPLLLFGTLFTWRDASALKFLNGVAVFALAGAMSLRARSGGLTVGSIVDYPFRLLTRWIEHLGDFVHLVGLEGRWREAASGNTGRMLIPVLRGLLIAAPLLLVFGSLLVSADEVFSSLVSDAFSFDFDSLMTSLATSLACTWLVGGFLRRLFIATETPAAEAKERHSYRLSNVEVNVALGALNLLFLSFVVVQFQYLFGGVMVVRMNSGLSYAEYARKGFFELVMVVGLALPALLMAHGLLKTSTASFRAMASLMVALLFVIMVSAAARMVLYVDVYGISQLRIYVFAIMGWLGLSLLWFCATVLREKPMRFAFGSLALGLATIFLLNFANPDALIARVNTSRSDRTIDVHYLANLSHDATPELVRALPRLTPEQRAHLEAALVVDRDQLLTQPWHSKTLSSISAGRWISKVE